jgi:F0F1-type ATP synthase assembly protein I
MSPEEPRKNSTGFTRQFAMATELPFILVGGVVIGGAIGYFLDGKLHTKPWLMLAFGLIGFAGGLRELLRRLNAPVKPGRGGNQNVDG